jgi:nucleoside-diphosphate-sugar epimerase
VGFAGRWLCEALRAAGWTVRGWSRGGPAPVGLSLEAVELRDPRAVERALASARPDVVFHLAALTDPRACAADPALAEAINVQGTRNLVAAMGGAGRLVLASTCHVYGAPLETPIPETHPLRPVGVYAETKLGSERASEAHPDRVVVRAFHHVGPGQARKYALGGWAAAIAEGTRPITTGDLSLRRDYTDVRDVAAGYVRFAEVAPAGAVLNLCRGEAPTLRELIRQMAGGEMPEVFEDPSRFRADDPPEIRGDPGRARALGWAPRISLDQSTADLVRSFRPT